MRLYTGGLSSAQDPQQAFHLDLHVVMRPDARAEQVDVAGFVQLANLLATG